MSETDAQAASKPAKKPFDVSVLFAICGMLFSLLIFLFLLKQERDSAIQQFNAEMIQKVADFQHALNGNLNMLHAVHASLMVAAEEPESGQQQIDRAVASNAAIKSLIWQLENQPVVWSGQSETQFSGNETIQEWISASVQSASQNLTAVDLDGHSSLLISYPSESGNLISVLDFVSLLDQGLSGSLNPEISLKILTGDGDKIYSTGEIVVAEDSIFNQPLSGDLDWVFSYGASEDYLSSKMSFMPALFLLIGLLLSFSIASYLKKLMRNLTTLREEQEVLTQQVLDANWNDPLTGLANRVHFDETLDIECRRAVRDFSPLSMMVVEIDQYAELVESYGKEGAEVSLQKVAQELQTCVTRPGDMIARTDEHQFSFILPSTNEMVTFLAERCLKAIEELQLPHDSSAISANISISLGLTTLQPSRELTPERLFKVASEQLHKAQESGGNQYVSFAEHSLEPGVTYSV